jgi:hypothetical protein
MEDIMRRTLLLASILAITWATGALADPPQLKGAYGFTGTAACLDAQGSVGNPNVPPPLPNPTPGVALPNSGFQPDLRPNDAAPGSSTEAYYNSFSVEGIRTFNGDGTGTVVGTAVEITPRPTPGPNGFPHFPPAAGSSNFSLSFNYTVDGNGNWTATMVPGSYVETFVNGPRSHFNPANGGVDQTATVDAIPPFTGMISQGGTILIAAHTTPMVEVHSYSNGDVIPAICHRSRVFIRLPNQD